MSKVIVSVGTGFFALDTVVALTAATQGQFSYAVLFAGFAVLMAYLVYVERKKA